MEDTIFLKIFLRGILNAVLDGVGRLRKFSFPEKYIWQWKRDFLFGWYEKDMTSLFKKIIQPGMAVIDVGAHIGYYTRIYSKLVGKDGAVYAFEADPENFELLEKNTKHLANVKRYQMAVADCAGIIDFYHCNEKSGCHSVLANIPGNFSMRKISVPSTDLDSFLTREKIKAIDFIKMDIEGGESVALRGMQKTLEKNHSIQMILEFAPEWILAGGVYPERFVEKIASLGFNVFVTASDGLQDFYAHPASDPKNHTPGYFTNIYCKRPILKG